MQKLGKRGVIEDPKRAKAITDKVRDEVTAASRPAHVGVTGRFDGLFSRERAIGHRRSGQRLIGAQFIALPFSFDASLIRVPSRHSPLRPIESLEWTTLSSILLFDLSLCENALSNGGRFKAERRQTPRKTERVCIGTARNCKVV